MKYTALLEESKITNIPRPRQRPGASLSDMYMYSENWNITWKILSYVDEFPRKKKPTTNSVCSNYTEELSQNSIWPRMGSNTDTSTSLSVYRVAVDAGTIKPLEYLWLWYVTVNLMTYQNDWKNLEVSKPTKTGWLECRFFMTQLRSVLNLSYK